MERANADYMGMLATVMNSLGLQNGLEKLMLRQGLCQLFQFNQFVRLILDEEQ